MVSLCCGKPLSTNPNSCHSRTPHHRVRYSARQISLRALNPCQEDGCAIGGLAQIARSSSPGGTSGTVSASIKLKFCDRGPAQILSPPLSLAIILLYYCYRNQVLYVANLTAADRTAILTTATLRAASQLGLTNKLLATVTGVSEATHYRLWRRTRQSAPHTLGRSVDGVRDQQEPAEHAESKSLP
jgi:hypothetical protein